MLPTENPWPAVIVCSVLAVVCLFRFIGRGKVSALFLTGLFVILAGGAYVLDVMVVTPTEVITANVYDLTRAFQRQDVDKTLSYFSRRAPERLLVAALLKGVRVGDDLRVTDVSVTMRANDTLAISHFRANASVSVNLPAITADVGYHPSRWELDWQQEGDAWKVTKVRRLNPVSGEEMGIQSGD